VQYPPRSANGPKALSNWEKKSRWLLTEIVKYDSYIESLRAAMALRLKRRGDKALERALHGAHALDERDEHDETDEGSTPVVGHPRGTPYSASSHRRESAEGNGEESERGE
jgi:PH/SEC7 domain-containing protein